VQMTCLLCAALLCASASSAAVHLLHASQNTHETAGQHHTAQEACTGVSTTKCNCHTVCHVLLQLQALTKQDASWQGSCTRNHRGYDADVGADGISSRRICKAGANSKVNKHR
jgi:hypothetical protein